MSLKKSAFNFYHIKSTDGIDVYVNPYLMATHYELFRQIIEKPLIDGQPLKSLHGTAYEWAAAMKYALECNADGYDEHSEDHPLDRVDEPLIEYINEYQEVMSKYPEIPVYEMVIFSDYIGYRTELMIRDLRNEIAADRTVLQKIKWTSLSNHYLKVLYEHCGQIDIRVHHRDSDDEDSEDDEYSDGEKVVKVTMHHDALQILRSIEPLVALDMMLNFVLAQTDIEKFLDCHADSKNYIKLVQKN